MGAMYGKRPLHMLEMQGYFTLSNNMYCVWGKNEEGLCVDVYRDKTRQELVSMQHGIQANGNPGVDMLKELMESMIDEF